MVTLWYYCARALALRVIHNIPFGIYGSFLWLFATTLLFQSDLLFYLTMRLSCLSLFAPVFSQMKIFTIEHEADWIVFCSKTAATLAIQISYVFRYATDDSCVDKVHDIQGQTIVCSKTWRLPTILWLRNIQSNIVNHQKKQIAKEVTGNGCGKDCNWAPTRASINEIGWRNEASTVFSQEAIGRSWLMASTQKNTVATESFGSSNSARENDVSLQVLWSRTSSLT